MSKQIGFLNEMKVMVELLSQGFVVSKPQGDYCPYDLISDHKGILHRLQIKSTTRGAGPASRNRGLKVLAAKVLATLVIVYSFLLPMVHHLHAL
ncbi:hypothetical protein LCGC14_0911130 [marine sediment metagenome]|uniref:PD(D/E)XK endonuclease domain-containing protein n=1 Tax=marine sediment metagenome TaxID=412755 RepID=A0A0F9PEG3_9ZZZZ